MATLITFNVGGDDSWLRESIRGERLPGTTLVTRHVIVEDGMVDPTTAALATIKHARQAVYGGCSYRRIFSNERLFDECGVTLSRKAIDKARHSRMDEVAPRWREEYTKHFGDIS